MANNKVKEQVCSFKNKKEGKEQGIKEGKIEGVKEVAKNLIKQGIDEAIISESTGLTIKEIEMLEK